MVVDLRAGRSEVRKKRDIATLRLTRTLRKDREIEVVCGVERKVVALKM